MRWMNQILIIVTVMMGIACERPVNSVDSKTQAETPLDSGQAVSLNSTVMLMGDWDWHKQRGRCKAIVDEALSPQHHNETLNFLPTQFHLTDPAFQNPNVLQYCHSRYFENEKAICPLLDKKAVQEFKEGLTDCFQYAIKKAKEVNGKPLNISIVPHIDDGSTSGRWRNVIAFNPYPREGQDCEQDPSKSYYCSVLKPIAEALRDSVEPETEVHLALQGEMGATVFAYPEAYRAMIPELRNIIRSGLKHEDAARVKIGLSMNFNRVSGELFDFNRPEVVKLFDSRTIDFVGISSYGEISLKPYPTEFENTINTFAGELEYFGISLKKLLQEGVELHFSEFGMGGGNILGEKSTSAWQAASSPWGGVHGPYDPTTSPWQNPELKRFEEDFYCAGMHYLSGQFSQNWKISKAFLWNLTSWDVQAVYPFSSNAAGSYRNELISNWIRRYNQTGRVQCPLASPLPQRSGEGLVLDNFDRVGLSKLDLQRRYLFNPKAIAVLDISLDAERGWMNSTAMKLVYRLGAGRWDSAAGLMSKGDSDFSGARGVSVWAQSPPSAVAASSRSLVFGVRERSGEYWELSKPLPQGPGQKLEFSFQDFKVPDSIDNKIGDRQLDLQNIVEYDLTISGAQQSTANEILLIDELSLMPL